MAFLDDLEAQAQAQVPTQDVELTLNGNLYTLRFRRMDGVEWATETDKHPARPGVLIDTRYGYNLRSLVKAVALKTGGRVEGDTVVDLSEDEWKQLWKIIDGSAAQRIGDAVWALNEWLPSAEVEKAKKALNGSATS